MPNTKKSIQIKDSYRTWSPYAMRANILFECNLKYGTFLADSLLNRSYQSMYIEWWLHNIGYYITKPFCFIPFIKKINLRCRDVDLEERQ